MKFRKLVVIMLVLMLSVPVFSVAHAESYKDWKQADSRWGTIKLGSSGSTMASIGCLVTSAAKLLVQAGLCSEDSFTPGTLVEYLNKNSGFTSGGGLYYGKLSGYGFSNVGDVMNSTSKTTSSYNSQIIGYINQGYHMAINVNNGGHWVAVDEEKTLSTGEIWIMDSISGKESVVKMSSRYSTFGTVHAWTGGAKPSAVLSFNNIKYPATQKSGASMAAGGTITSNVNITSVKIEIHNDQTDTMVCTVTASPNAKTFDLSTKSIDDQILFNKITGNGNDTYKFIITAEDASGAKMAMTCDIVFGSSQVTKTKSKTYQAPKLYKTTTYGCSQYKLYESNMTWDAAKRYAENLGGHLAIITSPEEQAAVASILPSSSEKWYLIGARDTGSKYVWVDGTEVVYNNYQSGEPDRGWGIEEYLGMKGTNGTWNDISYGSPSNLGFIVEITSHTPRAIEAVAPNCFEDGHTAGVECAVCGIIMDKPTILPALNHPEITVIPYEDATCTESGHTECTFCSICGVVLVDWEIIPPKGHTIVTDAAKDATCTESGLSVGSHCSVCNTVITAQSVVPAKGHTIVTDAVKDATCTESGLTEGSYCSVCGEIIVAQNIIPALGHIAGDWQTVVEATATTAGKEARFCTRCEAEVESRSIDPTGSGVGQIDPPSTKTVTCKPGEEVTVKVYVNAKDAASVRLSYTYDTSKLEFVSADTTMGNGSPKGFMLQSLASDIIGEVGSITFRVKENVADGTYKISVSVIEAYDIEFEDIACAAVADKISVKTGLPGDVNEDGRVNGKDSMLLLQYLSGWDVTINDTNADVNKDGRVNGKDSMLLLQYLSGWDVVLK